MQPLLLVLALCVAPIYSHSLGSRNDYNEDYDEDNKNSWQPEPLKPAPWQAQEAVVQAPEVGQIFGIKAFKNIANRPINAFLGVRYGKVGGGLARFQAAQPAGYQGRVNATVQSPNCAQFPELNRLREAESRGENVDDCLTLDIYAPDRANQLPVLVFVHGEMLFDGSSEEAQPDYILERDVLLVSINYRLAPFGFLSALTNELPGNVALSDIHLALEWLQRYLVHFGGDPGQVTLVGQAGGATLAHALTLSGKATNLFQKLILQSGTALNPYLIDNQPIDTLRIFANFARCPPFLPNQRGYEVLYQCLGQLSTSQLVAAFQQLLVQNERHGLTQLGGFKLVFGDPLGYLPSHPATLVQNGSLALPMIVGATKDASAFILSRIYGQISSLQSSNVSDYIDVVLKHTAPPSEHHTWKQWALREIFSPELEYTASPQTVANGLLELSNYILYRAPVINSIKHSYGSTPAYLYIFDYRGEHHRFGHLTNPLPFAIDASLSDDSVYLFPYPAEASRLNPLDRSLSRALVTMWVDFAITGVPNPISGVWPQATYEYGPFLRFTNSRQNPLELEPHFGEGNYLPNYSRVSYRPAINRTVSRPWFPATTTRTTTTTTTTTTSRPYVYNPYANWQNRPQQPSWHPADPEYVRAQEARQQEFIREREKLRREQQQRNNQRRPRPDSPEEQEERIRQERAREQYEREQRQREQYAREQRERERQEQEQREREQQERDQQERDRQEREQQEREEREREQREREQDPEYNSESVDPDWDDPQERDDQSREQQERDEREREQQEREQQEREQHKQEQPERDQQERDQQELDQQEREQQEREQQWREQQEREQQERDQQEREQQEREQQERDQQEREQQEREQQERDQQEREQQEREQQETGRKPYPSYEQFSEDNENPSESDNRPYFNEEQEREQQLQEQLRREQQEQQERGQQERQQQESNQENEPSDNPENYPSYEEYIKAQDRLYAEEQERERQQQERLHQERHQNPVPSQTDQWVPYPEEHDRSYYEEQEPDRAEQERDEQPEEDQEDDVGAEQGGLRVEDFPSYEAYVEAATKIRQEQEEQERLEEERYRAEQEEADRIEAERSHNA
ncbi:glutactin [Drosophila eugracilis]|uniref:glutactin n=1 Tax=Drosophila eugracilis TaxID=29029 RepID=UPI001BD94170|nr:glutactin [Drosophila eugracilis]